MYMLRFSTVILPPASGNSSESTCTVRVNDCPYYREIAIRVNYEKVVVCAACGSVYTIPNLSKDDILSIDLVSQGYFTAFDSVTIRCDFLETLPVNPGEEINACPSDGLMIDSIPLVPTTTNSYYQYISIPDTYQVFNYSNDCFTNYDPSDQIRVMRYTSPNDDSCTLEIGTYMLYYHSLYMRVGCEDQAFDFCFDHFTGWTSSTRMVPF